MATEYVPYVGPIVTRAEALAAGLTRFFTGRACKHGHLSERTSANGGCIRCNQTTCLALYHAESSADRKERNARANAWKDANRDAVRVAARKYAKEHREQSQAWKVANREKINAAEREARKRNPAADKARVDRYLASDKGKENRKVYRDANKEAIRRRVREWKLANPDRVLELRQSAYEANKEAIKLRVREWNAANPEAARARGRNYRARKNAAEGSHTGAEITALYAMQAGSCVYCGKALDGKYDADHIQPLARGGSNWIENIQLLCKPCNNRKRAIDPIEFARRLSLETSDA